MRKVLADALCQAGAKSPSRSWRPSWAARRKTLTNWLRQDQADRGERQDVLLSGVAVPVAIVVAILLRADHPRAVLDSSAHGSSTP